MTVNPFEQRDTAIASGLDPASLTERAARRRTGDAGLGRVVVVPAYLRRTPTGPYDPAQVGLLIRLSPSGDIRLSAVPIVGLGDLDAFWRRVHDLSAEPGAVASREGWSRVAIDEIGHRRGWSLVLRGSDWAMVCAALALRFAAPSGVQDAPVPQVLARFLGRLDGLDGTPSAGLWGRLALEVVSLRHPQRLADTLSLRWHASWGQGGFGAGSGGRAAGAGGNEMLLDLRQQQVRVEGRLFRLRTLPDWEREQAAYDLGLAARRLLAWPVTPVATIIGYFDDISPAPLELPGGPAGPQDAPPNPRPTPSP